jgi:uncharacterized protein YecT (DUF1311 family)
MRLLAILVLAGSPVWANEHEVAKYGHILQSCYDATADVDAKAECLGSMSTACMETEDDGQTTMGMTWCMSAEANVWDGYLNQEYQTARKWAKAADEIEAASFPNFAVRAEALLKAQRAWIAFRDAECGLEYAQWGAGSMRNIAYADCLMRMTAERALDLRRIHGEFE